MWGISKQGQIHGYNCIFANYCLGSQCETPLHFASVRLKNYPCNGWILNILHTWDVSFHFEWCLEKILELLRQNNSSNDMFFFNDSSSLLLGASILWCFWFWIERNRLGWHIDKWSFFSFHINSKLFWF